MRKLVVEKLTITFEENPEPIIECSGKSTGRDTAGQIDAFFLDLRGDLTNKKVTIDFTKMEYMNSVTVASIIKLFQLYNSTGIETKVIYDRNSTWQIASFRALKELADVMAHISVYAR